MWHLDHKEGWEPKIWCFQTVVLEDSWSVPWTARRLNSSILKEINPENSLEKLMLKWSNTLTTWCKELTHGKDHDTGKDWSQEEKSVTEDEMVGWHRRLNRHELEQIGGLWRTGKHRHTNTALSRVRLLVTPWTLPARLFCPWDSPGRNTGVGCPFLLQGSLLTQGLNPGLLHYRQMFYQPIYYWAGV